MARYFDRIAARFKRQEQKGIAKYGQILEDNPRGLKEALEYAAEEVTDLLMYLEEAMEKVGATVSSCGISREIKEGMRDLKADMELCSKATPGPYRIKRMDLGSDEFTCVAPIEIIGENGFRVVSDEGGLAPLDDPWTIEQLEANAAFIVNAREGWPEAIRRAIKAEETLESLLNDYTMILLNVPGADTADGIVDYIERIRIENAALCEENAKLLAVAEAAKEFMAKNNDCENKKCPVNDCCFCDYYTEPAINKLQLALADLEGGR